MKAYSNITEYIANYPNVVQEILKNIRELTIELSPSGYAEAIRYGIPTIQINSKNVLHYGAYPKHVALYPASDELIAKHPDFAKYRTGKGTIQFLLSEKIPYELVKKFILFRLKQAA